MQPLAYVIVNFGGPRTLDEVESFLAALLTDQEVLRTGLPRWIHTPLFRLVARQRAKKMIEEYAQIGGGSPIFADTEAIAQQFSCNVDAPVLTFHRYLIATHAPFFRYMNALPCGEIRLFPMFPQFTYATTGSAATFLQRHLSSRIVKQLRWIKSYPTHPAYIKIMQTMIAQELHTRSLLERETVLLFSAHGLPLSFIQKGDIYLKECEATFHAIMQAFPRALGQLCFQSKFGRGEWLRPYTIDCCRRIEQWAVGRPNILFVPISFTSDHIETLFEVEKQYMPIIRTHHRRVFRLPAMNRRPDWIQAIHRIVHEERLFPNQALTR